MSPHRTYSEIVWLEASWTAFTRANANRTTGLPNRYPPSAAGYYTHELAHLAHT